MESKKQAIIRFIPLIFAISALVFFILSMFNLSNNLFLDIGLILMGLNYLSNYLIKKALKEDSNPLNLIFGGIIFVIGIITLIFTLI